MDSVASPPKSATETTEVTDTNNNLLDKLNEATQEKKQTKTFWTCRNVRIYGPPYYCLCVSGQETSIPGGGPPGASPTNKIFMSDSREHWYAPVRCDTDGNWLPEEE